MKKPTAYSIEYKQFVFELTAKEPLILPTYKGSTIRGGFGYVFKRIVCAIKDKRISPTYLGRLFCICYQDKLCQLQNLQTHAK